jgi:hypothetical protein
MPSRLAILGAVSDYVPQASDVSEAVDRELFARLRLLTPAQRLQMAVRATQAMHRLSVAGLRLRFPTASEDELQRRASAQRVGPELLRRVFGEAAEAWLS